MVWHRLLGGWRPCAWHPPGSLYSSHTSAFGICAAGWSLAFSWHSRFIVSVMPLILTFRWLCLWVSWFCHVDVSLLYVRGPDIRIELAFKSVTHALCTFISLYWSVVVLVWMQVQKCVHVWEPEDRQPQVPLLKSLIELKLGSWWGWLAS